MHKFYLPTNKGLIEIDTTSIIRVEARSNYSKIYVENEYPLTVAKVLLWFEEKLPAGGFCRIHRGHLINRRFIDGISKCGRTIMLTNGEELLISKRKKKEMNRLLV